MRSEGRTVRRLLTVLMSASLAAVFVGGATAAAAAPTAGSAAGSAVAQGTCPFTRTLCLWDGTNFTGTRFTVSAWNPSVGTCVDLAAHGWPNGRAKSAINTGSQTARLYTTTNCTGTAFQIFPRGPYPSINFSSNSVYVF